jgi:WD40 repeat protein
MRTGAVFALLMLAGEMFARLGSMRLRHRLPMLGHLALSPDGSKVASFGQTIRVWACARGKLLRELDPDVQFGWNLAFTPDGRSLLASYSDGVEEQHLALFDLGTGEQQSFFTDKVSHGLQQRVRFSKDGRSVAMLREGSGRGDETCIRVHDFPSRKNRGRIFPKDRYLTNAIALSPDGSRLIAAVGKSLRIYDVAKQKEIHRIVLAGFPRHLAVSGDGKTCAWHGSAGSVVLVSLQPPFRVITSDVQGVSPRVSETVAFSADGKEVFFATDHGALTALDAKTGRRTRTIVPADEAWRSFHAFSANGRYFASSNRTTIEVFDTATGKLVSPRFDDHRDGTGIDAVPSPDGWRIATRSASELRIWDLRSSRMVHRIPGRGFVAGLRWSADGKSLAVGSPGRFAWYDAESGKRLREGVIPALGLIRASLLPDGKAVTWQTESQGGERGMGIIELGSRKERRKELASFFPMGSPARRRERPLALSPNGKRILLTKMTDSVTLQVRKVGGGLLWTHPTRGDARKADFLGSRLVVVPEADGIETWDVDRNQAVGPRMISLDHSSSFRPVALSPDGRTAVFARQYIRERGAAGGFSAVGLPLSLVVLIELSSGQARHEFPLIPTVLSAAFTSDGRHLITGSDDGTALVWDVEALAGPTPEGRLLADLGNRNGRVGFAAVSTLSAMPRRALRLLGTKLSPAVEPKHVRVWIDDLDAETFARRVEAERRLAALGEDVEEDLLAARKEASLEARSRMRRLLRRIEEGTPESLRRARGLEVLERIRSPEAVALLKKLAAGYSGSRLTRLARESLERLKARP